VNSVNVVLVDGSDRFYKQLDGADNIDISCVLWLAVDFSFYGLASR